MSDSHRHVDLDVLHLVERLLSRGGDQADTPVEGDGELAHLPSSWAAGDHEPSTHPAAHVPELPLFPKEPVTPLPRRR